MIVFTLLAALVVTVSHCRVTFTHSEVLQQSDFDSAKKAAFKCDNGCMIYTDSRSSDIYINDGSRDVTNFLVMGEPDKGTPTELLPSKGYKLVYRGAGQPPRFVFYAVDKKAPYLDTPVHAVSDEVGFLFNTSMSRRFTLLNSQDQAPFITFDGHAAAGYPRIYTTGFDATSEAECKPVYQARSQQSALNSRLTINSPIITVDKGQGPVNAQVQHATSQGFYNKPANSAAVYFSPGYVGCSYIRDQLYNSRANAVYELFSAEVKSLDLEASVYTVVEATRIMVNDEIVDFSGKQPVKKHFAADRFDVSVFWQKTDPYSPFVAQIDLGM